MVIETSLIISGGTIIASLAGSWAVIKSTNDLHGKEIEAIKTSVNGLGGRIDGHGESIVELRTKQSASITARECDDKYVSKELFRQFEKHIDGRFDTIESGVGKILGYLENGKRGNG